MKRWMKKLTALLSAGLMLAVPGTTGSAGAKQPAVYDITFRIQGEGTVRLENAEYGELVFDEGEKTLSLTPGSYVSVTAGTGKTGARENTKEEMISIAVATPDGIELEPESSEKTDVFTREITATEIDKVVDITFGDSSRAGRTAVMRAAAAPSENFPETGDKFTGTCTVKSVIGGNGHTVHGVTLTGISGILSGEGDIEADCAQHSAAAPVAGMKYDYTYTITSVDKSSGKVTGSIYFISQTQPATGAVDSEGYLIGYQALSGIFSIQREYSGTVQLRKSSANRSITDGNSCYSLGGAKYGVYSDAACGNRKAVLTVKEDGNSDMAELAAGRYYVKELSAPKGYALDERVYTVDVTAGNTAVVRAQDYPQSAPADILLEKADAQTGEKVPRGNASFADAEFTISYYAGYYEENPALKGIKAERTWVMKTDSEGRIKLQDSQKVSGDAFYGNSAGENVLPLGTVTIQETKAPTGYLVNEKVFVEQITSSGNLETVKTYNSPVIPEEIIRGDLQIVKFSRDPEEDQDQKTPLEGICFEIKSETTGETVEIITDENGYASTDQLGEGRGGLIYDTYTVHEKNAPDGLEPVEDFKVTISEEGKTLYYILEDTTVVSPVLLVKRDSTTGKTIPAAGARFKLLDSEKKAVTMTAYYPEKKVYDVFETNEKGMFLLPEKLPAGEYYFHELNAPEGYLICKEDIRFTIEESHDWDSPLEIPFPNVPVKGRIQVMKKDAESGETLEGAGFNIEAAEDIVTPDGTVRAVKGETVDTILTDESGKAVSKELFPGRYTVTESKQPSGYVRPDDKIEAEIRYKDQVTAVVMETIEVENTPVKFVLAKKEAGTDNFLPGVKFEFWKESEDKMILITGEDGTATVERLEPGTYFFRETEALPGYLPDDTVHEFTVDENGKIDGKEAGILTVENARTKIVQTKAVNADTGEQELPPEECRVIDTVSMENLQTGTEYMLRGMLMDQKTGEPLRAGNSADGAVLMTEKKFTAADAKMDVEMKFAFDAAAFAGKTIVVFEYLYQDDIEVSRHAELDNLMQQLYVKNAEQQSGEKKESDSERDNPQTGDATEVLPAAVAAAGAAGAVAVGILVYKKRRRK